MKSANDILALRERLKSSFSDRDVSIQINRDLTLGNHWNRSELEALGDGVEPVTLNYCFPVAFKNATFLAGRPPEIQVPVSQDSPEARLYASFLEKVLYAVYESNRMLGRWHTIAHNCSVCGGQPAISDWDPVMRRVAYQFPHPDQYYPVPGDSENSIGVQGFIREHYFTPEYLDQHYPRPSAGWHADHSDAGLEYVTVIRYSDATQHRWVVASNGQILDEREGYGFVPSVYIPNIPIPGGFDGLADITLIRDLQKSLNRLLTDQWAIIAMYAEPPVILEGTGQDPSEVQWGPGMKLPITKGGKVYFLQWEGTPPDFREHIARLITGIQDLSGIPDVAYGRYEASIQSGIALNTQFQPTRLMMSVKQNAWADAFEELNRQTITLMRKFGEDRPLDLYGITRGEEEAIPYSIQVTGNDLAAYVRSRLIWPGMLPKDDVAEVTSLLNQYGQNAISLHTLLEKLGHESPTDEIERIKGELADEKLHPELAAEGEGEMGMGGSADSVLDGMGGMEDMMGPSGGMGFDESPVSDEMAYAQRGLGDMM